MKEKRSDRGETPSKWKQQSFLLFIFLFVLTQTACEKSAPHHWGSDYDLSVMSFNLRYDTAEDGENRWSNRKEACLRMLRETDPDIWGIQEGLYHQTYYLKDSLPQYDFIGVGSEDGFSGGEYKAIFYNKERFEVLESNTFWLSETPNIPSYGWDANNIRIVSWAHFYDIEYERSFYVFNTHFDHIGSESRKESAKLLMKKIHEICNDDQPIFITGDFNALIRAPMFDPIVNEFYSARRFADKSDHIKSFNAFGFWLFSRNIDFIFYKNVHAQSFRTLSEDYGVDYISDHYPLISHFKYQ